MSVQLLGESWDHNGLEMSLAAHVRSHEENTRELLNIAGGLQDKANGLKARSQFAPLPPYVHQPFPKHLYHADGRESVVADQAAMDAATDEGFRATPYRKVRVAPGDPGLEKAMLKAELAAKDGQIATLADEFAKMRAQLDSLTKKGE